MAQGQGRVLGEKGGCGAEDDGGVVGVDDAEEEEEEEAITEAAVLSESTEDSVNREG